MATVQNRHFATIGRRGRGLLFLAWHVLKREQGTDACVGNCNPRRGKETRSEKVKGDMGECQGKTKRTIALHFSMNFMHAFRVFESLAGKYKDIKSNSGNLRNFCTA